MGLSTNSVFHFTDSIDSLKGILSSSFKIKYCLERIESSKGSIQYAVPMASFCDIPLSQVASHIDKYGGYGIGLFKRWATKKGLNPVLYLEKKSTILNDVLLKLKFDERSTSNVQEFLRYTKNYEGQLYRQGYMVNKVYRFYDEREWRYCPTDEKLKENSKIIHDVQHYLNNKTEINEGLSHLRLTFTIKDISYIIVKNEKEIPKIIDFFNIIFKRDLLEDDIKILISRIMTSRQIKTDF